MSRASRVLGKPILILPASACALLLLAGCGLSARQRAMVQTFGGATADFATITRAEFVQGRADVMAMNRQRVLLGEAVDAGKLDGLLTVERLQPRLHALEALAQYGALLQKLLVSSSAGELRASTDRLVDQLNGIDGVAISAEQGDLIGRAVAWGASPWVEHRRAQAVRRVVEFGHPYVLRVTELVKEDFAPDNPTWRAAYRQGLIDLRGAVGALGPVPEDNLAAAQISRRASLLADENEARFQRTAPAILQAADQLARAAQDLRIAMLSREASVADLEAFRRQVIELRALYELLAAGAAAQP